MLKVADERAKAVATAQQKLQQTEAAYEIDKRKRLNTTVPKEVARSAALAAKHAQDAALEAEAELVRERQRRREVRRGSPPARMLEG